MSGSCATRINFAFLPLGQDVERGQDVDTQHGDIQTVLRLVLVDTALNVSDVFGFLLQTPLAIGSRIILE